MKDLTWGSLESPQVSISKGPYRARTNPSKQGKT